ncbi:nucleotidyltransferase family protein [Roseimicrobium sp. ORNL1]|uniref:nucleotidyltransferase family protein n=1 Tax=Roseimicrobium sp. ORNL1 TaxID=2711231 RepID=UPI0013E171BB|nr:nucleotidyltransferase family protein [Roseimicrobium sp. ORNL1]QIF05909.1 nucleotidyltransferase family protein [Roseimicrobium sp. ORNL1]
MHRIGGIVLAAGGSTRLGSPKQLLRLQGESLVRTAVKAAQQGGCDLVCVVTGHAREAVEKELTHARPLLVHNEKWGRGMGSSIRLGVTAVQPASAVILLACDQPAVDAQVVRSLIAEHYRTGQAIVASQYSGTCGIPVLFDESCFPELANLADDRGAKSIIEADMGRVAHLAFPEGALDLDSPADLEAWRKRLMSLP